MATLRLVPVTGNPVDVTQDVVLLGRDPGCEIVLTDGSVSRKHARIERRGESWFVVDQGSANGTFVDGARVTESGLKHGQELRVGAVLHRIEIQSADPGATVLTEIDHAAMRQVSATPAPAPPPPPPPMRTAPPPPPRFAAKPLLTTEPPLAPKKGRGPWLWIGGGCCGCVLLIVLVVGGVFGYGWKQSSAAFGAVQQMVSDLQRGDQQAAYGRLSRSLQEQMSVDQFASFVATHPGLARNANVTKVGWHGGTGGTRVTVLLNAESGEQEQGAFDLVTEDGGWRISSMEIEGGSSNP